MLNGIFYQLDARMTREIQLENLITILGYEIILPHDDLEQDQKTQKIDESSYIMYYTNQIQIITLKKDVEHEYHMIELQPISIISIPLSITTHT